ncbi:MAG: HAMP domain-containing sensor histidine kinase [Verrucomicrobiota bacterium]
MANTLSKLRWTQSRWLPVVVICLALVILGTSIFLLTRHLQTRIQAQIVGRDAETLHAVAIMQHLAEADTDPTHSINDPVSQSTILLKTSRLKGVMGARLFDARGKFVTAFPEYVMEADLTEAELVTLRQARPVSRFQPKAELSTLFLSMPQSAFVRQRTAPVLEVIIPLHKPTDTRLAAAAQYLIDGQGIAEEFSALRRVLFTQALWMFACGGLLLVLTLGWTFRRLQQTNRQLQERTLSLLAANQELALSAKTSAVGAITANLMHGLKSPLFGLQYIVASRTGDAELDSEMQTALDTTRKMQSMINKVMEVLREERGMSEYEVSLPELAHSVAEKMKPVAEQADVYLISEARVAGTISARTANLVILILANLLQNAIEATPKAKTVRLTIENADDGVRCVVRDEGPGIPADVRAALFSPCKSTKKYGSGIGLSISKQLAHHLGADLYLEKTTGAGTTFVLSLPARVVESRHASRTA